MTINTKINVIRTICWIGAAADALWAVALVNPQIYAILTGRPPFQADLMLRLSMGIGASLMAGWTLLLVWTACDPIERRAVLLFTAFPVLVGLSTITLIGFLNGNLGNTWILSKCAFLGVAMLTAYYLAATITKEAMDGIDH